LQRDAGQFLFCLQTPGIERGRLQKALFRQVHIAFGERGAAEPVLQKRVLRRALDGFLQGIHGVARLSTVQQDNAIETRDFRILGVLLHQRGDHGLGGAEVLHLKQHPHVTRLHGNVLGILGGQVGELGFGLVELSGAGVIIRQNTHALGLSERSCDAWRSTSSAFC